MEVRKMFQRKKKKQNDFVTGVACGIIGMRILSDPAAVKLALTFIEVVNGSQETTDSTDRDQEPDTKDN